MFSKGLLEKSIFAFLALIGAFSSSFHSISFFLLFIYIYIYLKIIYFLVLCKDKTPNKMPASLLPPRQRFGRRRAKGSQSSVLREGTSAAVASQQREKGTPVSFDYFILFLFFYCIFFFWSKVGNVAAVLGNTLNGSQESPLPLAFVPNGNRAQRCSRCTQQLQGRGGRRGGRWGGDVCGNNPGSPEHNRRFHSGFSSPFQKLFPAPEESFAKLEAPKPEPSAAARGYGAASPRAPNIHPEFHPR